MALLYRFVKLNDRANTNVFTFVVTKSVTRDLHRDVTSKEFNCGYQKWAITFSRSEKLLGVYLVWRNPSGGNRVYVDFGFTIMNRDHFSTNESFVGKQIKFTADLPAQGNRKFITISDLYNRNFMDENGEFQLELAMNNIRTVYETELKIPSSIYSPNSKPQKLETSFFNFGCYDWNILIHPNTKDTVDGKVSVMLQRLTGFDHQCHVKYNIVIGEGDRRVDSGIIDDISDTEGKGYAWHPRSRLQDLVCRGTLKLHMEMILANTCCEVLISPSNHHVNATGNCFDRDMQSWFIEADANGQHLRLRLVYKDINNVPRNHLR